MNLCWCSVIWMSFKSGFGRCDYCFLSEGQTFSNVADICSKKVSYLYLNVRWLCQKLEIYVLKLKVRIRQLLLLTKLTPVTNPMGRRIERLPAATPPVAANFTVLEQIEDLAFQFDADHLSAPRETLLRVEVTEPAMPPIAGLPCNLQWRRGRPAFDTNGSRPLLRYAKDQGSSRRSEMATLTSRGTRFLWSSCGSVFKAPMAGGVIRRIEF